MAIYPKTNVYTRDNSPRPSSLEAWTQQAARSLNAISLSDPSGVRGTSASLAIPLDEDSAGDHATDDAQPIYRPRRESLRRDSLKRREALLKGKEGSRRRQRWENDRLLNNPWAQPPLPIDWEVHPTYPRKAVPYYLAPLWDENLAAKNAVETTRRTVAQKPITGDVRHDHVAKELKQKLKKAKAAKGLLQDLEEEVRKFVKKWEEKAKHLEQEGLHDLDSEDEEIVFVGRNGQMNDMLSSPRSKGSMEEDVKRDKLVFNSLADDHGASFGRWLVHSIATYYGLRTWSVTVGDPARREAYVGIRKVESTNRPIPSGGGLPRPLWGLV